MSTVFPRSVEKISMDQEFGRDRRRRSRPPDLFSAGPWTYRDGAPPHTHTGGGSACLPRELLHPVGTPAGDTGTANRAYTCSLGRAQHLIDKSAVKVDVGGEHRLVLPLHQQLLADLSTLAYRASSSSRPFSAQVIHVGRTPRTGGRSLV